MPDITFRIRTEGGVKGLLSSIQGETDAYLSRTNRELERVFNRRYGNLFSSGGGYGGFGTGFGGKEITRGVEKVGSAVRTARIEFDQLNNTMRVTAETGIRTAGGFIKTGDVTTVTGNLRQYLDAVKQVTDAEQALSRARQNSSREISQAETRVSQAKTVAQRSAAAPYQQRIDELETKRVARASTLGVIDAQIAAIKDNKDKVPLHLAQQRKGVISALKTTERAIEQERAGMKMAMERALLIDTPYLDALQASAQAKTRATDTHVAAARSLAYAKAQESAAFNAAPQLPSNVAATFQTSPQLKGMLMRAGLGKAPGLGTDFTQNIVQSAKFNAPYLDLVRNVTKVGGEFTNAKNQIVRFGAEIDKNGRVVTRFGGQLSGVGGFLRMIQRDFVKVIEWTVATTAVIGGLGAAMAVFKQVNEVDKLLQRFAITAQMTGKETRAYFNELAKVAYQTATPLNEMVKVADDLALATKQTGQTTSDWTRRISEMGEAVGILTNIAGLDTAAAADVLTSTMKQLGLETSALVGVLNKVSAVAGGQQQAISDITKGLGVMAESGKQAGLSIDQQIATIQVLGQVTSKSSSEVATAFKNLVGSIDSVGSIKVLKQFGIQVKDAQGNARNFLEIYKDIATAIQEGVIPEGRVKEVVRGIAGGPRRAPDAAALLSNVMTIFEVEKTSVNAANEALLANAKILDTNNAKLTQLKVKLDQLAFEKFATIVRDTVGDLTGLFTNIVDFFRGISNDSVKTVIQFGLFLLALKAVSIVAKGIEGIMISLVGTIRGAVVAVNDLAAGYGRAATNAQILRGTGFVNGAGQPIMTPAAQPKTGGLVDKLFGGKGGLASTALTVGMGTAFGAITSQGQGPAGTIGSMLQSGGMMALLAGPHPLIKLIGGIAAIAGTAIQGLEDNTKQANDTLNEHTEAILNATTAYGQSSNAVKDLQEKQSRLIDQINMLSGRTDSESINARISAQNELAQTTASLFEANNALAESFNSLNQSIIQTDSGGLGVINASLIEAAKNGLLTAEQIDELRRKLEYLYLMQAYPGQYIDKDKLGGQFVNFRGALPTTGGTVAGYPNPLSGGGANIGGLVVGAGETSSLSVDLRKIQNIQDLKGTLFKETEEGLKVVGTIPRNLQSITILWDLINKLSTENADEADRFAKAMEAAGYYADDLTESMMGYARLQAQLNYDVVMGNITPEQKSIKEAQFLAASAAKTRISGMDYSKLYPNIPGVVTQGMKFADERFLGSIMNRPAKKSTIFPDSSEYKELVRIMSLLDSSFASMSFDQQANALKEMGFNIHYVAQESTNAADAAGEFADELEAVQAAAQNTKDRLADLSAELYDQYLTGDLTASQYATMSGHLKTMGDAADVANDALEKRPDFEIKASENESWNKMIKNLEKIPGFENAASMSTSELITKIVDMGTRQGATNQQTADWAALLIWIGKIITDLPDYKLTTYEIRTVYNSQGEEMYSIDPTTGKKRAGGVRKKPPVKETDKPPTPDKSWYPTPYEPPSTSGGSADKAKISDLEIPDEWKDAGVDISKYLRDAVAWAKKYQGQIPGENKEHRTDLVAVMLDNKRILLQKGIAEEYLRKAMQELTDQIKKQNELLSKADTIRRIRVGAGDFAALANVPMNSRSGVSVGSPEGPISINLDINGQLLTPAQFDQLAEKVAAALKSKLA